MVIAENGQSAGHHSNVREHDRQGDDQGDPADFGTRHCRFVVTVALWIHFSVSENLTTPIGILDRAVLRASDIVKISVNVEKKQETTKQD